METAREKCGSGLSSAREEAGSPPAPAGASAQERGQRDGRVLVLLQGIVTLPRILRMYAETHRRRDKHAQRLAAMAEALLPDRGDALELRARPDGVVCDGQPLEGPPEFLDRFSVLLRANGLAAIVLRAGVTAEELRRLGEWLATNHPGERPELPPLDRLDLVRAGVGEAASPRDRLTLALQHILDRPQIRERLLRLCRSLSVLAGTDPEDSDTFLRLALDFFAERNWPTVPPHVLERTILEFIERLDTALQDDQATTVGVDRLVRELFEDSFHAALRALGEQEMTRDGDVAYERLTRADVARLELDDLEAARASFHDRLQAHCHDTAALLVQCELLATAEKHSMRERLREGLKRAFARRDLAPAAVVRAVRELTRIAPREGETVEVLGAGLANREALAKLLGGMRETDLYRARGLVQRLTQRRDAFDVLVGLMRGRLAAAVRHLVIDALVRKARARTETWLTWGLAHTGELLDDFVFGVLIRKAPDLLAPIAKEVLTEGQDEVRKRLVDLLVEAGTDQALRLLVCGMTFDDRARDRHLVDALGAFRQPLAVSVLREVVHRCNATFPRREEAERAILALRRIDSEEANSFLNEIAIGRGMLLPRFRGHLRRVARDVLQGRWKPCVLA